MNKIFSDTNYNKSSSNNTDVSVSSNIKSSNKYKNINYIRDYIHDYIHDYSIKERTNNTNIKNTHKSNKSDSSETTSYINSSELSIYDDDDNDSYDNYKIDDNLTVSDDVSSDMSSDSDSDTNNNLDNYLHKKKKKNKKNKRNKKTKKDKEIEEKTEEQPNRNIVEQYILDNKQLIIVISGFSGSGKTMLAREIERDFKLHFINTNEYYIKDFNKQVELNNTNIIDWDNPDAIDWDKLNEDIKKYNNTVVISCLGLIKDKITFKPDFHIHLKISKEKLIENRTTYLDEHKGNKMNDYDENLILDILNKITYPHYLNYLKQLEVNKFIKVDSMSVDDIYDETFNYLISQIEKYIYNK